MEDNEQVTSPAAREILAIFAVGLYRTPSGRDVSVADDQSRAEAGTRLYSPEQLAVLREAPRLGASFSTSVDVIDATTQEAARAHADREGVALLNFASAWSPGGGFLSGAKAQEEELCRCSGLYRTLRTQAGYYDHNRSRQTPLYSDFSIYSPRVPFIRMATREPFLDAPFNVSVVTAPAPNAGAIARNEPSAAGHIPSTFERRWSNVFAIAEDNRDTVLILGAWGCGVFKNDPTMVATAAKTVLSSPRFHGAFERVVFAIPGSGRSRENLLAFRQVFGA